MEIKQSYINQFTKIRLLQTISDAVIDYGVQNGNDKLPDYIDLNCGGIPEGNFDDVIDPEAPLEFLKMYTKIAENRFAFAVTELEKMNPECVNVIGKFCYSFGNQINKNCISRVEECYNLLDYYWLDGLPEEKTREIVTSDESCFEWKKLKENHKEAWDKAGGDVNVYYFCFMSFANGLLSESGIYLQSDDLERFTLSRK